MVERKKIEWRYIGIALIITAVLFTGIFMLGQSLSKYKVNTLENDISDLRTEQRSVMVTYRLAEELGEDTCVAQKILTQQNLGDLYEVRQKVISHQNSRKIKDPRFRMLKKEYMTILIDNYVRREQLEKECGEDKVKVLYFYSDDCKTCQGQGKILTNYRRKYDEELLVYPLDTSLNLQSIDFLERYYDIEEYPSIVIEGEVHEGFVNRTTVESEIKERLNQTNNSNSTNSLFENNTTENRGG